MKLYIVIEIENNKNLLYNKNIEFNLSVLIF